MLLLSYFNLKKENKIALQKNKKINEMNWCDHGRLEVGFFFLSN